MRSRLSPWYRGFRFYAQGTTNLAEQLVKLLEVLVCKCARYQKMMNMLIPKLRSTYGESGLHTSLTQHHFPISLTIDIDLMYFRSPRENFLFRIIGQYITDIVANKRDKILNHKEQDDPGSWPTKQLNPEDGRCTVTVDVLDMFVDVSALVREKSGFTQYTNHCYTVNKDTERLIIELVSWKSSCMYIKV